MTVKAKILGALGAVVCLSGNAWGYTIGTTDVGGLDTYLAETTDVPNVQGNGSSPANELAWVNGIIEPNTTFTVRTATVSYSLVDGETDIYAFALQSDPGYYVLKNTSDNWALFQNLASSDWAVFDLSSLTLSGWNLGGEGQLTISHVSEFGGSTTQVPEPGTLALFSLGLLGLAVALRRRRIDQN